MLLKKVRYFPLDGKATDVFEPGEGVPVVLSEVKCTGGEARLTHCPSAGLHHQSSACERSPGVVCSKEMSKTLETLCIMVPCNASLLLVEVLE